MNFDFLFCLLWATICCGLIAFFDKVLWSPRREPGERVPFVIDNARGFFPVLLLVFLIRSFLYQPFKVPTESLEPTLLPGDFLIVNQYHYGIRLPVWLKTLYPLHQPKRGDILVFRWPVSPDVNFVKRVVGVPGDTISYTNKVLSVNGIEAKQVYLSSDKDPKFGLLQRFQEDLLGVKHGIYRNAEKKSFDFAKFTIPEGYYFAMGDNRDESDDSRYWGLVPDSAIIGQATRVWLSIDPNASWLDPAKKIRWERFWQRLYPS